MWDASLCLPFNIGTMILPSQLKLFICSISSWVKLQQTHPIYCWRYKSLSVRFPKTTQHNIFNSRFKINWMIFLKSKTFLFSSILPGFTDFGMTITPLCICHRITTYKLSKLFYNQGFTKRSWTLPFIS